MFVNFFSLRDMKAFFSSDDDVTSLVVTRPRDSDRERCFGDIVSLCAAANNSLQKIFQANNLAINAEKCLWLHLDLGRQSY